MGVETEGLLDYQGRAGMISIVRWNLRPVIFGVEFCSGRTMWPQANTAKDAALDSQKRQKQIAQNAKIETNCKNR